MESKNEPVFITERPYRGIEGEMIIEYENIQYRLKFDEYYSPKNGSHRLMLFNTPGDMVLRENPPSKEEKEKELPKIVHEKAEEKLKEL